MCFLREAADYQIASCIETVIERIHFSSIHLISGECFYYEWCDNVMRSVDFRLARSGA